METEIGFTLEYLSIEALRHLLRVAEIDREDYATARELTQADHDAMSTKVETVRKEIASR